MRFKDAWNPSPQEIKKWAYGNWKIPEQDWELAIYSFENIPMICSLVEDENCKRNRRFFLSTLYVFSGDIVRGGIIEEIDKLSMLLKKLDNTIKSKELKSWINHSKSLINNPESYNYTYWGLGSKYVY